MAKPVYTKPTSELDAEARLAEDFVPAGVLKPGVDPEKSENGYVGVDPIYQTFANDTEQPLRAEDGVEKVMEEKVLDDDSDSSTAATPESVEDAEDEDDEDEDEDFGGNTPPTPNNPQV